MGIPHVSKRCGSNAFDTDALPKPVAQALDGWMKASQATAIIVGPTVSYSNIYSLPLIRIPQTALLAGVQAGMIAVIEALPDSGDSALWRAFRCFVYAGLFFDLGATLSSVYITVQGAALPVLARRQAMAIGAPKSAPYLQIHEPDHTMPRYHLDGWHGVEILEEFGMNRLWRYVAYHMLWNFVLGYICLVVSIVIWVCGREEPALFIPIVLIAVGTAVPVYGFLRFIVPL